MGDSLESAMAAAGLHLMMNLHQVLLGSFRKITLWRSFLETRKAATAPKTGSGEGTGSGLGMGLLRMAYLMAALREGFCRSCTLGSVML